MVVRRELCFFPPEKNLVQICSLHLWFFASLLFDKQLNSSHLAKSCSDQQRVACDNPTIRFKNCS
jgi:hypothetical protein